MHVRAVKTANNITNVWDIYLVVSVYTWYKWPWISLEFIPDITGPKLVFNTSSFPIQMAGNLVCKNYAFEISILYIKYFGIFSLLIFE